MHDTSNQQARLSAHSFRLIPHINRSPRRGHPSSQQANPASSRGVPSLKKPAPPRRASTWFGYSALLVSGGAGYYGIELAVRGWSHWSMALCGGLCLVGLYLENRRLRHRSLLLRAACGAAMITAVELAAGCILNLWLDWRIWDYGSLPLNLWGQICPKMTLYWFLLSIPACLLCTLLLRLRRQGLGCVRVRGRKNASPAANRTRGSYS